MANYYINAMASTLQAYDNSKFDIAYYKALAWGGLEKTDSYKTGLTKAQKTDITRKDYNLIIWKI